MATNLTFRTQVLPNGARIIHARQPSFRTAAFTVGIHVGSRFEPAAQRGMSHLLEHMLFKGSTLFKDSKATSKEINDKGGYLNAYTDKELTAIQVRVASAHDMTGARVAMELACRPLLRPRDLEKEKPVVCDEVRMYEADDDSRGYYFNDGLVFGTDAIGAPIAGTVKTVKTVTPAILRAFHAVNYVPSRMVVAMTGNYTENAAEIVRESMSTLDQLRKGPPRTALSVAETPKTPQTQVEKSITPRARLLISFRGPSAHNKRTVAALNLASMALGGYMSARLFLSLREKHGLCYSVGSFVREFSDATMLTVYMELEAKNVGRAIELLGKEIRRFRRDLSEEELAAAKSHLHGSTALTSDSVLYLGGRLVSDTLLAGKAESLEDVVARHQTVSLSEARQAVREYVRNPQTTILVPDPKPSVRRAIEAHIETIV